MADASLRDTIARVAREEGISPEYALAVAERESSFNPNARASKSIAGLYQMMGSLRHRYGAGDSSDPEEQTRAFARFTKDFQGEMRGHLGRDPSNSETYLGHFWGGPRAARVLSGHHGDMAPADIFSARELAENPHLARGRSASGLAGNIMADIDRRQAKYGGNSDNPTGNGEDFASYGEPADVDFAQFGQPQTAKVESGLAQDGEKGGPLGTGQGTSSRPGTEIDLSQYGVPAFESTPVSAKGPGQAPAARGRADPIKRLLAEQAVTNSASRMPDEIPPDAVLGAKGIAPSRKHGDAIDYNSTDVMRHNLWPDTTGQDI